MEFPKKLPEEWLAQLRKQSSEGNVSTRVSIRKSSNKGVIDPTFGKTTVGATSRSFLTDAIVGSHFVCPENGTAESISWYGRTVVSSYRAKCAIYRYSDNSLVAETEELTGLDTLGWHTHSFSEPKPSLSANTEYWLVVWFESDIGNQSEIYTDYIENAGGNQFLDYTGNFPDSWSPTILHDEYSIYCTYTPAVAYTLSGYTKDASGNPLGNCNVVLFDASDDSVVGTTISDANGYFQFTNLSKQGPFYLRACKTGTSNLFGATTRDIYANGSVDIYLYQGEPTPENIRLRPYPPVILVETIAAKTFPMLYLSKPVTAQELISKVEGATVKHVAKDFPEALIKDGKAEELRSKFSS